MNPITALLLLLKKYQIPLHQKQVTATTTNKNLIIPIQCKSEKHAAQPHAFSPLPLSSY